MGFRSCKDTPSQAPGHFAPGWRNGRVRSIFGVIPSQKSKLSSIQSTLSRIPHDYQHAPCKSCQILQTFSGLLRKTYVWVLWYVTYFNRCPRTVCPSSNSFFTMTLSYFTRPNTKILGSMRSFYLLVNPKSTGTNSLVDIGCHCYLFRYS